MSMEEFDRVSRSFHQIKALIDVAGAEESIEQSTTLTMVNIFWLLEEQLTNLECEVSSLAMALRKESKGDVDG